MSTAEPSAPTPNPSSPHLNPADSDRFAGTLPPDPLLQSGCFIDATETSNGETLAVAPEKPSSNGAEAATTTPTPTRPRSSNRAVGSSSSSAAPKTSSNGGESAAAMAENAADGSEDSRPKRRRRTSAGERRTPPAPERRVAAAERRVAAAERRVAAGETPDWLPAGWIVEDRVRASGATAGLVDKYYCDPISAHVFRSKKEVLYFLENGTKRKKTADSSDAETAAGESSGSHKQKASAPLKPPPNFDFSDPPEKVTWVLTDSSDGSWAPFVDDKKVPDPTAREWSDAFKFVSSTKKR